MGNTTRDAVCWSCRRAAKVSADQPHERRCPECQKPMVNLGKYGAQIPPRKDGRAWASLQADWGRSKDWNPKRERAERIGRMPNV